VIIGFVEAVRPFQVRGWAYDPDQPDLPLTIEVLLSGQPAGTGEAALFRDDLRTAGHGNGHHGFILNLDSRLPIDTPHLIEVRALSCLGESDVLPQVAAAAEPEPAPSPSIRPARRSAIRGFVGAVLAHEARGWAFDPSLPDAHLTIEVYVRGTLIGATLADQPRADLVQALIGSGDHGFTFTTDAELPTSAGSVEIRATSPSGESGFLDQAGETPATPAVSGLAAPPEIRFPGHAADSAQRPVFILGAARSGTSAMAQALVRSTRYAGHEEGHLLDLVSPLLQIVNRHYETRGEEWSERASTLIAAVPKRFIDDGVRHIFVELARTLFPAGWWLDKTPRPGMISCAPLLRQIWPEARFIFMKRRGIENIASRMRKFPMIDFEAHCRDWALAMQSWAAVRSLLEGAAIEIDQLHLARQPGEAAGALAPMLLLQPKETAAFAQALAMDQPERTSERFASAHGDEELGWTPDQQTVFQSICSGAMRQFGYAMEDGYFAAGQEQQAILRL